MAETKIALLDGLRKDLTCPICHWLSEEPKLLPCLHDICADCLEKKTVLQNVGGQLECPICKYPLGVTNVQELPTNLTTQNMVKLLKKEDDVRAGVGVREGVDTRSDPAERKCGECDRIPAVSLCSICNLYLCKFCEDHHKMAWRTKSHSVLSIVRREEPGGAPPQAFNGLSHNPWKCDKHPDSDVDMYCRDCEEVICLRCAVCPPHKQHNYDEAKKLVGEYYDRTDANNQRVADLHDRIRDAAHVVEGLLDNLEDNKVRVKREIAERHDILMKELEREKEKLLKTAEGVYKKKQDVHNKQLEELKAIANKLDGSLSYVRRVRSEDNCIPVEFMALCKTISHRLDTLHDDYKDHDLRPRESDVVVFKPSEVVMNGAIGAVQGDPCPYAYTATNVASTHFIRGKEARLRFECRDILGNVLTCPENPPKLSVSIIGDNHTHVTKEADFVDGSYQVNIIPPIQSDILLHVRRELQLVARALEQDIADSPFPITVSPPIVQPVGVTMVRVITSYDRQLERDCEWLYPFGIVRSGDVIAVSDHSKKCIQIYQGSIDNHIESLTKQKDEFSSIRGIAFDSKGHLLVVKKENHCVSIMPRGDLNELASIGTRGNGDGQFELPSCVAVDSKGYIFVTDSMNQRVQYFNPDYTYSGQLGHWGQGIDEFHEPYGIALDSKDRLFVTSRKLNKVHIFERGVEPTNQNPLGYVARCVFGDQGTPEQKLQVPVCIAVDSELGYVYVTEDRDDNCSRVSVFTSCGEYVASFKEAGQVRFSRLIGVCVLENHNILLADSGNKQVIELCLLDWNQRVEE